MKLIWLLLLFPALVFAGEDCSMMSGKCRDVCAADEEAVAGAFLDCTSDQECCIKKELPKGPDSKGEKRRDKNADTETGRGLK